MVKIIKSEVIHGKKLWRQLGFPTANLEIQDNIIDDGVYKVNIIYKKKTYHGAASYSSKKGLLEVNIFHFDKNIYGEKIKVIIFDKIRDNKKFESLDELKYQIKIDIMTIKNIKDYVLTFGTFDHVHAGHEYYLSKAKRFWDRLVTIVATDKNVEKFKSNGPKYPLTKRIQDVKDLQIADIVSPWNEDNPLIWLKLYMPKVICLWYDQNSFTQMLEEYIQKENLDIFIKRLKPYKAEKFKSSLLKDT